jgi:hypothetical protein
MLADTSFPSTQDVQNASRLYALRDGLRDDQERNLALGEAPRKRPRCARCGVKLLLVRISGGFSTCFRCDDFDPRHEIRERHSIGRGRKAWEKRALGGPVNTGSLVKNGGKKIRRMRETAGLTKIALSRELGVSDSTLRSWEDGRVGVMSGAYRAVEEICREYVG